MRTGKTISELSSTLLDIQERKVDLIVPTDQLKMDSSAQLYLEGERTPQHLIGTRFGLNNWSHAQVTQYTNIPKAYYDRIRQENPHVLSMNVNHGFQAAIHRAIIKKKNESRMLRTLDGNIRGFVSSKYRRLDAPDLLEAVLPILNDNSFEVVSSELTEKRMYLKVTTPKIQGEIVKGKIVQYGLVISTSDVGSGSVRIEPLMYECWCDNGCISETAMRKFHIGKDQGSLNIEELLSDETKAMDDEVFWRKVQDLVRGSMDLVNFEREMQLFREAHGQPIKNIGNLEQVVDLSMKELNVTGDAKKRKILEHLASGADGRGLNKYGLSNAFSFAAHQVEDADYEECTELERAAGKVIVMPKQKWDLVAG